MDGEWSNGGVEGQMCTNLHPSIHVSCKHAEDMERRTPLGVWNTRYDGEIQGRWKGEPTCHTPKDVDLDLRFTHMHGELKHDGR